MVTKGIPTSSDIYLEVNGRKVAVVQSYTAQSSRTSTQVEAFGESTIIPGKIYKLNPYISCYSHHVKSA